MEFGATGRASKQATDAHIEMFQIRDNHAAARRRIRDQKLRSRRVQSLWAARISTHWMDETNALRQEIHSGIGCMNS